MIRQQQLHIPTPGRGAIEITDAIADVVAVADMDIGIAHVFIMHTSASLMICENADPEVLRDLERFTARLVPDGDPIFRHRAEGPDDMPAHVRSIFTQSTLAIPISGGRMALGTWQGVFLWEHRMAPQHRRVVVSVDGQ